MSLIVKIGKLISKQIIDIKTYGLKELFRKFSLLIKNIANIIKYWYYKKYEKTLRSEKADRIIIKMD